MSNIGKTTAQSTYFEWQTDVLASVDTDNAAVEGDDAAPQVVAPTTRVGNYTQISRKTVSVTGTIETVNKAGRRSELAYQMAKRASELKRDMEAILTGNQPAVGGDDATPRKTAGFEAFIRTNSVRGAGGANPTLSGGTSGYPNAGATDGTQVAITEDAFKEAIQKQWTSGGKTDMVIVGPYNKAQISKFAGIATRFRDVPAGQQAQIIGAADVYVSDFGEVTIVPDRFSRERTALFVDTEYAAVAYLRSFQTIPLAKTGDSEKRLLLVEYGLKVHNEQAHAVLADLTVTA
ncbi:hypothetical protein BAU07_06475 [Bordetella flabilis]|uniref:Capsid protein n=2 Tax=Bordetella flabilis TaxID=463014 RepID=A0A193GLY0_9BORD|nr:hypothetical protein BAU07_06475 [Bordetella flabilis]